MTRNKIHAFLPGAALALCAVFLAGFISQARAQAVPSPVPLSQKIVKTHFSVVHMTYQTIQVSSLENQRALRTFNYDPKIRDSMQKLFDAGGYQYGDRITVWYHQGGDVALKIRGKPSKPK